MSTLDKLMVHLGDCLLSVNPQKSEGLQLHFQHTVHDAMTMLPELATGLDVTVQFTGVSDFEYTFECRIFALLGIALHYGRLVDPQTSEAGKLSCNQLVEKIFTCKYSSNTSLITDSPIAEQFPEPIDTARTYRGLCELMAAAKKSELSVLF